MTGRSVIVKKEESVAILILNRPQQMNAINEEMYDELFKAFAEIGEDDELKAMIITGTGRAFCSGFDFNSRFFRGVGAGDQKEVRNGAMEAGRLIISLRSLPKPVIAAVNGYAIAGGLSLALASDVIVASEKAKFSEGHLNLGSHPDCGTTYFLPRLIGTAKAFELTVTGKTIDAKEAERIGLVNRVVLPEHLEATAKELSHDMIKAPLGLLKLVKPSIYLGSTVDLVTAIENESTGQGICCLIKECREIAGTYMEKFKKGVT